jgi:hypothetical protein
MSYPRRGARGDTSVLADYLRDAQLLADARERPVDSVAPTGLRADVEMLRWFELPAGCLVSDGAVSGGE